MCCLQVATQGYTLFHKLARQYRDFNSNLQKNQPYCNRHYKNLIQLLYSLGKMQTHLRRLSDLFEHYLIPEQCHQSISLCRPQPLKVLNHINEVQEIPQKGNFHLKHVPMLCTRNGTTMSSLIGGPPYHRMCITFRHPLHSVGNYSSFADITFHLC